MAWTPASASGASECRQANGSGSRWPARCSPTSPCSCSTPTAAELTDDLLTATTDRAVLLITHRLDGLDRVNEILVLKAGRVVERGTHTELLRAKGRFHDLWAGASGHTCAG